MEHCHSVREEGFSGGRKKLVREILQYLVYNPEAKDTIEGIRACWLAGGNTEPSSDEIQKAIHYLQTKGWVTQRPISLSETIYRLNKDRLDEIKAFLCASETEES